MRPLRRFYIVLGLVAAAVALMTMAFATPLLGTRADFSVYNTGWNGASEVGRTLYGSGAFNPLFTASSEDLRVQPASLDAYSPDPLADAVLILGPRGEFTEAELATLRDFVERGGVLLVADDFGTGNDVLAAVGAEARFRGDKALDFAFAKRPEFTVAIDFADHPLTDRLERALLNYPGTIQPGTATRILANTTEAAWLDLDDDGERGATEPGGPFAWLAIETVGAGQVVLLSDPSVLINGMRPFAQNAQFAQNVVDFLQERGGTVVVDEAHRGTADPLAFVGVRLRSLPTIARLALVVGVAGAVLVAVTGGARKPFDAAQGLLARLLSSEEEVPPREPLLERARRRHPEWDETALREILDSWGVDEPR